MFLLTACGKSLEDQVDEGLKSAEKVFYENNKVANEEIDGLKFYKPSDFTIKEGSDSQNIILTRKMIRLSYLIIQMKQRTANSFMIY